MGGMGHIFESTALKTKDDSESEASVNKEHENYGEIDDYVDVEDSAGTIDSQHTQ